MDTATNYNPDILRQAFDAALLDLGETWQNALSTGYEWLLLRATQVIEATDDVSVVIVNSTKGTRYTVARDGSSCGCPAYQMPLMADDVDKIKPCKHRGSVIVENYYLKLLAEEAAREQYRATMTADLPYIPGVNYVPGAWEGTPYAAAERQRLGDDVVDAAVERQAAMPVYDRQAAIDARAAWMEAQLNGGKG